MGDKINLDNGWKFFLGDLPPKSSTDCWGGAKARAFSFGAVSETFDDSRWRTVDIPHDFVGQPSFCGWFVGGRRCVVQKTL